MSRELSVVDAAALIAPRDTVACGTDPPRGAEYEPPYT